MHYLICCEVASQLKTGQPKLRLKNTRYGVPMCFLYSFSLNIPAKENFGIFRERNFIFPARYLLSPFPKILVDLLPKSTFSEKQEEISNFREPFLQKARMATTIPHCIIKTEH